LVQVDQLVRQDAQWTIDWRLDMWKSLLPQVPEHLLLGKGFAVSKMDFELLTGSDAAIHVSSNFSENQYMALSGGYHNGPLSVILGFGIWGCIALVWFWIAGIWVLYNNNRYGDPALRTVNMYLMIYFGVNIIFFILVGGDIGNDILDFGGFLGLSVSLNGGVCHRAPQSRETNKLQAFDDIRSHLQPTFRRPKIRA
jgi:hypothetical protein